MIVKLILIAAFVINSAAAGANWAAGNYAFAGANAGCAIWMLSLLIRDHFE